MSPVPRRSLGVLIPDGDRLCAVRLVRRGGRFQAAMHASLHVQANLLGDAPDVVASELVSQLAEHDLHEKRWLLAVPPSWLASVRIPFPEAAVPEMWEYAWLQAEQQLSVSTDQTVLAVSPCTSGSESPSLSLFAMKAERLSRIEGILEAGRMRLIGAVPAVLFHGADEAGGVNAVLTALASSMVLQVTRGDHVVLLREVALENEAHPADCSAALRIALRIALSSLPDPLRAAIRSVGLVADARRAKPIVSGWSEHENAAAPGTDVPPLEHQLSGEAGMVCIAEGLSALAARPDAPLLFRRRAPTGGNGTRRGPLARALAVAGAAIAMLAVWSLHGVLSRRALEREANALEPRRVLVEGMREQTRALSVWYDRTPASLAILQAVTEAFPERGTVWATGVTISEGSTVNLVGKASDASAWLTMQETLRRCPKIHDLRVSQTRSERGEAGEMTFLMTFKWSPGPAS